jgi:hypothetical protein
MKGLVRPLTLAGVAGLLALAGFAGSRAGLVFRPTAPLRAVLFGAPPPIHDLGVVPSGGRVEVPFVLLNASTAPVTLGQVTTSCACLRVTLQSQVVSSEGSVNGTAIVDFSDDPHYRGSLLLTAEAKAVGDPARNAFRIQLDVDVR